jgi:hypothetical protein
MNEKYFSDCKNPGELDARYQQICQVFGLDSMPDQDLFKQEVLKEYMAKKESFTMLQFKTEPEAEKYTLQQIQKWVESKNLKGERIGRWLWVSNQGINGHKDEMKTLGFRFSQSKQRWYWRADEDRSSNPNPLSIEAIRRKYGSKSIGVSF